MYEKFQTEYQFHCKKEVFLKLYLDIKVCEIFK